jgi:hypothetical protein
MVTALPQTRLVATLTGKEFEQRRQPLASNRKEIQEMDARATVSGSLSSTRILGFFVSALLVALLIGGAGGYLVRAVTYTVTTTMSPASVPRPFVVEQPPYSAAPASPAAEPILNPAGFVVPI